MEQAVLKVQRTGSTTALGVCCGTVSLVGSSEPTGRRSGCAAAWGCSPRFAGGSGPPTCAPVAVDYEATP
jgi:hypothetical protein